MKKARLILWGAVLLVCLSILSSLPRDRYSKTVYGDEMSGDMGVVGGNSRGIEYGMEAPAGLLTATNSIRLDKGSYKVILRYHSFAEGNTVAVYSPGSVNSDNTLGVTLASYPLPNENGGQEIVFPIELDHALGDIQVQTWYGGEGEFLVHHVTIMSEGLFFTDTLFIALFILLAALWFDLALLRRPLALGEVMQDRFLRYAPVFLVVGLGMLASYPILNDTLSIGHDVFFHPTRLEGIASALLDGQFPPRINPDALNYKGYATSLMYPDLLMWPFALFRLMGFSWMGTYKLVCVATNLASAALSYLAGSRIFRSQWAGAVTAVLYTFAQYRLYNLYLRDALGEAIAMAVFPLFLWGLYEVYFGDRKKWPLLVLGVSFVLQSHIITTFVTLMFCALFFVVFLPYLLRNKDRIPPLLAAVGLTVLVNLWFIVPLFRMMREDMYVTVIHSGFYNQLSDVTELLFDVRYSYNSPGAVLFFAGAFMLAALLFYRKTDETAPALRIGAACLSFGTVFTFLASTLSPWYIFNFVPIISANISRIQFPQRFFAVCSIFFALCGGALVVLAGRRSRMVKLGVVLALTAVCFFCAGGLINSSLQANEAEVFAERLEPPVWHTWYDAHIGFWEYLYNGYDLGTLMQPNLIGHDGALAVADYVKDGTHISFSYTAEGVTYIDLPQLYYPGYKITDGDGNRLTYTISPDTFIRIENPPPSGSIQAHYTGLGWWRVTDCISLLTIAGWIGWTVWRRRKTRAVTAVMTG